ncbi:unnamed protein product [Phytophthora fragariaefolia]|uniref:Unnamed protein product n=1 Tax=Phytophthora fragariaefolia TaxID=1490495 RepID=A0A9W7CR77_9STRA|nr:unnamed protein product [Phytophthora fragariaefolia]
MFTWIDRVDLALKDAGESGRGKGADSALYYILGNKLMENAARWWVNMNRQLPKQKRMWSTLKRSLSRRYGEKKDNSAAEWRVSMRPMMPGETYADFAARLRDVVGPVAMAASSGAAARSPISVRLTAAAISCRVTATSSSSLLVGHGAEGLPPSSTRACSPATTVVNWLKAEASAATSVTVAATALFSSCRSSGVSAASVTARGVSALASSCVIAGATVAVVTASSAAGAALLVSGHTSFAGGESRTSEPSSSSSSLSLRASVSLVLRLMTRLVFPDLVVALVRVGVRLVIATFFAVGEHLDTLLYRPCMTIMCWSSYLARTAGQILYSRYGFLSESTVVSTPYWPSEITESPPAGSSVLPRPLLFY